jgi:hypothetical protein
MLKMEQAMVHILKQMQMEIFQQLMESPYQSAVEFYLQRVQIILKMEYI